MPYTRTKMLNMTWQPFSCKIQCICILRGYPCTVHHAEAILACAAKPNRPCTTVRVSTVLSKGRGNNTLLLTVPQLLL